MNRPLAGDLKMDIVMRLAELVAVLPDGAATAKDAETVMAAVTEIERLQDAGRRALAIADERGKENDRLRAKLEQIAVCCTDNMGPRCNHRMALDFVRQIANSADEQIAVDEKP